MIPVRISKIAPSTNPTIAATASVAIGWSETDLIDGALDVASHLLHAFRRLAALIRYAAGRVLGLSCKVFDGACGFVSQIVDF
jgi:hypothetical protein